MCRGQNTQRDGAVGLSLCSIGPHLNKEGQSSSCYAKCFLSFQMIHPVLISSTGVTWSLSMGSATTNFMGNSAVGHAQGRADPEPAHPPQNRTIPANLQVSFFITTTNHRGTATGFEEWIESQQPPESTSRSTWYSKGLDNEKG